MTKDYDVVLIRHAQSLFNQAEQVEGKKLGIDHLFWVEAFKNQELRKNVIYNSKYMDPFLSEEGRRQCEKRVNQCSLIKPDLILVSPYKRALQTCNLLFPGTKAPVIVQPIFQESFKYSCDVPRSWQQNKSLFPTFNFEKVQKLGDRWYLQNLDEAIKDHIITKIQAEQIKQWDRHSELLLEVLRSQQIYEKPHMLRQRTRQMKKMLREYKKNYNKIVVVAHYHVLEYLLAKSFDQNSQVQFNGIQNCHPHYQKLSELQKIQ